MAVPSHLGAAEPDDVVGRTDADQYATMITDSVHPQEVEAVLRLACDLAIEKNEALVQYLRGKGPRKRGRPGYEGQSPRWRTAEAVAFNMARALAAVLLARYPSPTGQPPIQEARALISKRIGPLCNGWREADDALTHHQDIVCPVHGED